MTFTHDGNYPGDMCASTSHPGHKGLGDSQYKQWKIISDFYKWCKSQGVYLRVPDYYFSRCKSMWNWVPGKQLVIA